MASSTTISSLLATATTAAVAAATSSPPAGDKPQDDGDCELLGPFSILIQGALGILALSSLVFKRWRERPQRPVKIWSFDVSKQVVGSILLHLANLLMSMLSSGDLASVSVTDAVTVAAQGTTANPCSFYLLNLAIDTTLGIPILIVLLRILTVGASMTPLANPPESIKSGHYGDPPKAVWWLKQCLIYFIGLLGMKLCVFFIFKICPWIGQVGDWALRWTEGNEALQIAFVMLIFPVIMNAMQYYIIDTFIKEKKQKSELEPIDNEDGDEEEARHLQGDWDDSFGSEDEDEDAKKRAAAELRAKHDGASQVAVTPDKQDLSRTGGGGSKSPE